MIRATIREIESELDRPADSPPRTGGSGELPGLVGSLLDQFKCHFELEENGGLLGADAENYDSDMLSVVERLVAEYRELERGLGRVLRRAGLRLRAGHDRAELLL